MRFAWLLVVAGCGGGDKKWPDQPLATFEGKVGGHAYTIELPSGSRNDTLNDTQNVFQEPFVSIGWTNTKETLAEDKGADVTLHEEQRADGHAYARADGDGVRVFAQKYAADGAFFCSAAYFPIKAVDGKAQILAVEKMCLSIKPK